MTPPGKDDILSAPLTPTQAYLAMYNFVRDYWERGGRRDGSLTMLVHDLRPSAGHDADKIITNDPALWDDWLAAARKARNEGFPAEP
jgi:hypothetical protein